VSTQYGREGEGCLRVTQRERRAVCPEQ
jgi:hypothetical protein